MPERRCLKEPLNPKAQSLEIRHGGGIESVPHPHCQRHNQEQSAQRTPRPSPGAFSYIKPPLPAEIRVLLPHRNSGPEDSNFGTLPPAEIRDLPHHESAARQQERGGGGDE